MEDIVVRETVNPTDCEFTSQKQTNRPQVLDLGRNPMRAAAMVQIRFAPVAVRRRAGHIVGLSTGAE